MPDAQPADILAVRREHERWLVELTALPTASGHEEAVVAWIERWTRARPPLKMRRDRAGNLFITAARRRRPAAGTRPRRPIFITAHLDHPAFVVVAVRGDGITLEFRGGVHDPYFENARLDIRGRTGWHHAEIVSLDSTVRPFKQVVARVVGAVGDIVVGGLARWRFDDGQALGVVDGHLRAHACDDLAGVAAALAAMDELARRGEATDVGLLFTRAEEVGFVGAIAACQSGSVPVGARLICLETSRSFAESPVGAGPIVRVGDRTSVFDPRLTNAISALMTAHEQDRPGFRWQRKLMPGGTCEATTFGAYGYASTCLCLPLGNYHNMVDIDDVRAGRRPARVGPEFISLDDFHGLVEMLVVCATRLDTRVPSLRALMDTLMHSYGHVLRQPRRRTSKRSARQRRSPTAS